MTERIIRKTLYRYATLLRVVGLDTDDVAQELRLHCWRKGWTDDTPPNVLHVTMQRRVLDLVRQRAGRVGTRTAAARDLVFREHTLYSAEQLLALAESGEPIHERNLRPRVEPSAPPEADVWLRAHVDRLPAPQRDLVTQVFWHDERVDEYRRRLNLAKSTTYKVYHRALRALRQELCA